MPPTGGGNVVEAVEGRRVPPDSPADAVAEARPRSRADSNDFTLSEAIHNRQFWILLAASSLSIASETASGIHIIPIRVWQGADERFAAGLVSVFFLLSIPARLGIGMAGQFVGFQPLIVGGMASDVAGYALLIWSDGVGSLCPFVALLAIYEGSAALQWVAIGDY